MERIAFYVAIAYKYDVTVPEGLLCHRNPTKPNPVSTTPVDKEPYDLVVVIPSHNTEVREGIGVVFGPSGGPFG